jgi:hypothetical protein
MNKSSVQGALFDVGPALEEPAPALPAGPRPWDPIDQADAELGWQYRYVTPARAREIAREIRDSR